MKIKLNLDNDSIINVHELVKNVYNQNSDAVLGKNNKMIKSIAFDISDKFEGKYKSLVKKQGLFDSKKKTEVTLKWHEAWALETLLHYLIELAPSSFAKIKINQVIAQLNQKLA